MPHTEALGRALCLTRACGGERLTGWDAAMVAHALGAVSRDDEMDLPALAPQTRQERTDDALVVGMGERGKHGTTGLARRIRREPRDARSDTDRGGCGRWRDPPPGRQFSGGAPKGPRPQGNRG